MLQGGKLAIDVVLAEALLERVCRDCDAVVCILGGLVLPVYQAVPLATRLRIETDLLVPACGT